MPKNSCTCKLKGSNWFNRVANWQNHPNTKLYHLPTCKGHFHLVYSWTNLVFTHSNSYKENFHDTVQHTQIPTHWKTLLTKANSYRYIKSQTHVVNWPISLCLIDWAGGGGGILNRVSYGEAQTLPFYIPMLSKLYPSLVYEPQILHVSKASFFFCQQASSQCCNFCHKFTTWSIFVTIYNNKILNFASTLLLTTRMKNTHLMQSHQAV